MNVLLLEDDENLARATTRLIQRTFDGATVRVVRSCVGAVEALAMEQVDVIVSDYEVIGGTADVLLQWVRDMYPQLATRFVFFSGSLGLDKLHDKVIEKGCSVEEFVEQLRGFVGGAL